MTARWRRLFHVTDGIIIPFLIMCAFGLLMIEGRPSGLALVLFVMSTSVMVGLWSLMRDLRAHATATRAAAIGEPDELATHARAQLDGRFTARGRAPFYIYMGMARAQQGAWDEALRALDEADAYPKLAPSWRLLSAVARVGVLAARGDAAGARATLDARVVPAAQRLSGPGVKLLSDQAEAEVRFAEGDAAAATPTFQKMSGDVRLGPAVRALAHWYLGRAATAAGDAARADRHFGDAAKLAPRTFTATRPGA